MPKCRTDNDVAIRLPFAGGTDFEVDACIYKETERYENVTVIISKCEKCGHIDISWVRQPNTKQVEVE